MNDDQNNQPAVPTNPTVATNSTPSAGQFMDIQSPKPSSFNPAYSPEVGAPAVEQNSDVTPEFVTEPPVDFNSTVDTDSVASEPASEASGNDYESPEQGDNNMQPVPPPIHNKKRVPFVPIAVALIVSLGLTGTAVYMYLQQNKSDQAKIPKTTTQTIADKPQASASDVDETTKAIDSDLSALDESTDFSNAELSDTTLGL